MLRVYIQRACDVQLEQVEIFEKAMRKMHMDWTTVVEDIYETNELESYQMFKTVKEKQNFDDDDVVNGIVSFLIQRQHGLDLTKFKKRYIRS